MPEGRVLTHKVKMDIFQICGQLLVFFPYPSKELVKLLVQYLKNFFCAWFHGRMKPGTARRFNFKKTLMDLLRSDKTARELL